MKALSFLTAFLFSFANVPASQQAAVAPQRDPQALAILTQAVNAAGGIAGLSTIQDFTATGQITYYWA
jgi:hypothetical protein